LETEKLDHVIAAFQPNALAVTVTTEAQIADAMAASETAKTLNCPVFWGGHAATVLADLVAKLPYVDYVGISEGEYTLLELLDVISGLENPEDCAGIVFSAKDGTVVRTQDRPFADLADFPPLNYSLVQTKKFFQYMDFASRMFHVFTSKGCPYKCSFCFNENFHKCQRRRYPLEVVMHQIRELVDDYGVNGVVFEDEMFGGNKEEFRTLCNALGSFEPRIYWAAQTVMGILSREELELAYASGCRTLVFGLESGSAEMRKKVQKYYDAGKIDETFRTCRELGISTMPNFIIGFPQEIPEQVRETVHLILRVNADVPNVSIFTPVPGSKSYADLVASGSLKPIEDIEEYARNPKNRQTVTQNFSLIPTRELRCISSFFYWVLAFGGKSGKKTRKKGMVKVAVIGLLNHIAIEGLRRGVANLVGTAKIFLRTFWYSHAYPSILKKYDLYKKNFGRTDWDTAK
jgi:radical SAM superfamily enzyme YgiQ (UPF0313 family)